MKDALRRIQRVEARLGGSCPACAGRLAVVFPDKPEPETTCQVCGRALEVLRVEFIPAENGRPAHA